jgi:hypothetical protein
MSMYSSLMAQARKEVVEEIQRLQEGEHVKQTEAERIRDTDEKEKMTAKAEGIIEEDQAKAATVKEQDNIINPWTNISGSRKRQQDSDPSQSGSFPASPIAAIPFVNVTALEDGTDPSGGTETPSVADLDSNAKDDQFK